MKKYLSKLENSDNTVNIDDELPLWSAPFGIKLLENINYQRGLSALDIGFGSGFPLIELAMRLGEDSVVYGIDPCRKAIERVNKKINYYGIKNIKIIEGIAESIPLGKNSVDLITSNNGINNVSDVEKTISECSRIINKGGQFVFTLNLDKTMFEFYDQFKNVLQELKMEKEIKLMYEHISKKRPPLEFISSLLQKYQFTISDIEYDQFNYRFSDGTAMLNHHQIRLGFMDSWINLLPEGKTEQVFDIIESRLNEQSKMFGGFKLSIPYVMVNTVKQ